jgi:hypothetical protein
LLVAVLIPIAFGPASGAAGIAPGCTAVGGGIGSCSYTTGGGRVEIAAVTALVWVVYWGPPSNPTAHRCGIGRAPGFVFACSVPAGNRVTAGVFQGVITARDRPGKL